MRRTWHLVEAIHAVVYFAAETKPRYEALGLHGFWRGYFASRSAPLGVVASELVTACFHSFSTEMVSRAIPDVWTKTSPEAALEARHAVMDDALRRLWGDLIDSPAVHDAANASLAALADLSPSGRPMYESLVRHEPPDAPHLRLFWAVSALREYRGDGHIAVLRANALDGAASNRLMQAAGLVPAEQQRLRGWSDDEWANATQSLQQRGAVDGQGRLTGRGREMVEDNERATDDLAAEPFASLGEHRLSRLTYDLETLVRPIVAASVLPFPNPMALPGLDG